MIKAYCINLDRKPEQFKQVTEEFQGILDIERVSAIDGLANGISGATALFNTQIQLFEKLIQTSNKYAIVIEDDVYRLPKFSEYWPQIVDFI
jgi:GR25 family glycosyltransferase involved in LPS biosynthesis